MKLSQQIKKELEKPQKDIEEVKIANELANSDKEMSQFIIKKRKK